MYVFTLTQDHSQLYSNLRSVKIQNIVRAYSSVTVSLLQEIIKQQYDYSVKYRRVWKTKRKVLISILVTGTNHTG